jgi:hypothetical protein
MSLGTHSIDGSADARHVSSGPVHAAAVHVPSDVPPTVGIRPLTATVVLTSCFPGSAPTPLMSGRRTRQATL